MDRKWALKILIVLAVLLAVAPGGAQEVGPGYDIEMSRMIPMRDGVQLEAWIFEPSQPHFVFTSDIRSWPTPCLTAALRRMACAISFIGRLFCWLWRCKAKKASSSLSPSSRCRMPLLRSTSFRVSNSNTSSEFWLCKREIPISAPSRTPMVENSFTSRRLYRRGFTCCTSMTPTNSLRANSGIDTKVSPGSVDH